MCIKTEFRKGNRNGGINLQYLAFQLRDAGRSESIISQTASKMGHKYKIPCRFQNMNKNKNPSKKTQNGTGRGYTWGARISCTMHTNFLYHCSIAMWNSNAFHLSILILLYYLQYSTKLGQDAQLPVTIFLTFIQFSSKNSGDFFSEISFGGKWVALMVEHRADWNPRKVSPHHLCSILS